MTAISIGYPQAGFQKADSVALSLNRSAKYSLERTTVLLTKDLDSDLEKARAIFRWIANNIDYDCRSYQRHLKNGKVGKRNERWESRKSRAEKVLKNRKALCGGYANLMQRMCEIADVKCVAITGFCKDPTARIGSNRPPSHAWNAIFIEGQWYMCDPTWAAGYTDIKVTRYTRRFEDLYFQIPPKDFILSHYPEDKKWKLTYPGPGFRTFMKLPVIEPGFYRNKINNFYPEVGIIRLSKGDTVAFVFSSNKEGGLRNISFQMLNRDLEVIEEEGNIFQAPLTYTDTGYSYRYIFKKEGRYKLAIYLDGRTTFIYDCYISKAKPT